MRYLAILMTAICSLTAASAQERPGLDLRSIPISDWLNAGEHADIPWYFSVRPPFLRIDQRVEVAYIARISERISTDPAPGTSCF
jgi:hypothetical protein